MGFDWEYILDEEYDLEEAYYNRLDMFDEVFYETEEVPTQTFGLASSALKEAENTNFVQKKAQSIVIEYDDEHLPFDEDEPLPFEEG